MVNIKTATPPARGERWGRTNLLTVKFWKTSYLNVIKTKQKQLLHLSLITYLMCSILLLLTISIQLPSSLWKESIIFICLHFFLVDAVLQKPRQGNFKDPVRVALGAVKKIIIFWRFQNDSVNLFGDTSEENWFLVF